MAQQQMLNNLYAMPQQQQSSNFNHQQQQQMPSSTHHYYPMEHSSNYTTHCNPNNAQTMRNNLMPPTGAMQNHISPLANLQPLQVADMRRGLLKLRKAWEDNSPNTPILLSDEALPNGMTIARFAFNTVLLHHVRRHSKSQSAANGSNT